MCEGRDTRSGDAASRLASLILVSAVLFNAALAIVNGRVVPLGPTSVIAVEAVLFAAAHAVALVLFRARMTTWYVLAVALLGVWCIRAVAIGSLDPKPLRDVLLIPTFVLLGMTTTVRRLHATLIWLHALILSMMLVEAMAPQFYADLFSIQSFYINTRGISQDGFWNTESTMFVSAFRPGERFFDFIDLHRASSFFLEPVSLGNYCVIVSAYTLAFYREFSVPRRAFLLLGTAVLLVGCDGRLALVSIAVIAVARMLQPLLPPFGAVLIPPAILGSAIAFVGFLGLTASTDDFTGRVALGIDLLRSYDMTQLLGLSHKLAGAAVDNGLAYLIATQSVIATTALWLFIGIASREHSRPAVAYKMAVALYLGLAMLVSYSFLSIKTASLLWFVLGVLQNAPADRESSVGQDESSVHGECPEGRKPHGAQPAY